MVLQKSPLPLVGELVVARITQILHGYVQAVIEDYKGIEVGESESAQAIGMVHITELSNRWVKNIHSIVSVGQRVILQVLKINPNGGIDLSLRRVTKQQRTSKMNEWRYENKIESALKFFTEQRKIPLKEMYEKLVWPISEKYGDLRTAFEDIKEIGIEELDKIPGLDYPKDIKEALFHLIQENIIITQIQLIVEYEMQSQAGNGIEMIKEAVAAALKIRRPKGVDAKFAYIGAPTYRCEIEAKDYPTAEKHLQKITDKLTSTLGNSATIVMNRDNLSNKLKPKV